MPVKILGLVRSCTECPHRQYYSGGVYECAKLQQPLTPGEAMPMWCPLSDHPAVHIAPAQRAVADTREMLLGLQKEIADGVSAARIRELVDLSIQRLPQA
jgi:hypothetical protein